MNSEAHLEMESTLKQLAAVDLEDNELRTIENVFVIYDGGNRSDTLVVLADGKGRVFLDLLSSVRDRDAYALFETTEAAKAYIAAQGEQP
jgi:hypothetical protein